MALRKELAEAGFDAGAVTVSTLTSPVDRPDVPSVSTIWRVLKDRGFVVHQPQKRPRAVLDPVRVGAAQRDLAGGHDPLVPGRRDRGGDPRLRR